MNRIRDLRRKKGLTIAELSKKTGISKTSLTNYENEKRTPRDMNTWDILADYFHVTTPYIMGIDNATPEQRALNSQYDWDNDSFRNETLKRNSESLSILFDSYGDELKKDLLFIFQNIAEAYVHLYENDEGSNFFEAYRKLLLRITRYATIDTEFGDEDFDLVGLFNLMKNDEKAIAEFFEYPFYTLLTRKNNEK